MQENGLQTNNTINNVNSSWHEMARGALTKPLLKRKYFLKNRFVHSREDRVDEAHRCNRYPWRMIHGKSTKSDTLLPVNMKLQKYNMSIFVDGWILDSAATPAHEKLGFFFNINKNIVAIIRGSPKLTICF
jgi:hypothetical protein